MLEPRLIDANEALRIAMMGNVDPIRLRCYAAQIIRATPTADAALVVHAEWVYRKYSGGDWWCSHCSGVAYLGIKTPYCPHCGAKMDGGNKNEEE